MAVTQPRAMSDARLLRVVFPNFSLFGSIDCASHREFPILGLTDEVGSV